VFTQFLSFYVLSSLRAEISGSHGDVYENGSLLGYCEVSLPVAETDRRFKGAFVHFTVVSN
jgi:hypothetical protein